MITYVITPAELPRTTGEEYQLYQDGLKMDAYVFCKFPGEAYIGQDHIQFYIAETLERMKQLIEQNLTTGYIYTDIIK